MKITHYESPKEEQILLEKASHAQTEANYISQPLSQENLEEALDSPIVTVFVNSTVNQTIIDSLPNLKLLITRSTGFDHIDVEYAKSKGITVCNIPAYGSRTVAEFTFALLLSISRKLVFAVKQIKENNSWDNTTLEGFNLQGKTFGVIGTGRIGQNVIQIAKGFDMTIIANDAFPNQTKATELGFEYKSLEEVLKQSDIITFHVPATKETHHLINKDNVHQIKHGAVIVNTSRGDVIDPGSLLQALKDGIIAGAALDVMEGEQELKQEAEMILSHKLSEEKIKILLEDHALIDFPNVIITPHMAFNSKEARAEIATTTIDNINKFVDGQPQNQISN